MERSVVVVSSWGGGVSFSGVLRHVLAALGDRPIYVMALDLEGEHFVEGNVTVIPSRCEGYEPRKAMLVFEAVARIRPGVVFFFFDHFAAQYHHPVLQEIQRRLAPVVTYVPIDGTLVDARPLRAIGVFERAVFYTRAARRRFLTLYARDTDGRAIDGLARRCRVIAHGVDRETFRRLPGERREAKEEAFPGRPELHETRIVLNGNKGWERKRLDLTLEGFARFSAHGPEDVHLVLRLPGSSREDRRRLVDRADALGIGDRVAVGRGGWKTTAQLNALYNACEVGINTAMGEGWGLISCEHGAAGSAQIVTDDEQLREIWGEGATYLETEEGTEAHWACPHVEYRVPSPASLAAALQALFGDRELRCDRSRAAAERMAHPAFDWRSIEAEWAQLFDEVLAPGAWRPGSSGVAPGVAAEPPDFRR